MLSLVRYGFLPSALSRSDDGSEQGGVRASPCDERRVRHSKKTRCRPQLRKRMGRNGRPPSVSRFDYPASDPVLNLAIRASVRYHATIDALRSLYFDLD